MHLKNHPYTSLLMLVCVFILAGWFPAVAADQNPAPTSTITLNVEKMT